MPLNNRENAKPCHIVSAPSNGHSCYSVSVYSYGQLVASACAKREADAVAEVVRKARIAARCNRDSARNALRHFSFTSLANVG